MSNTFLYIAWGVLYAACAGLGFITAPEGFARGLMIFFSLVFFVPPFLLLHRAVKAENRKILRLIRNLSLIWLGVTMLMIILNISSVALSETAGNILYGAMVVLTSPMVCGQYWLLSLFLWACLLMTCLRQLKNRKG